MNKNLNTYLSIFLSMVLVHTISLSQIKIHKSITAEEGLVQGQVSAMIQVRGNSPDPTQISMLSALDDLLNPKEPLYQLSNKIPWEDLEKEFAPLYSKKGRP